MLRKIIDGKSLEISQENVYERVSFIKVANFAIKIAHHIYALEYVPKTSCLKKHFEKKNILRKSLWWTSFLVKLQPCSTQPSVL